MGSFLLVFRHYFMRTIKDRLSLLIQIVFPIGIILTFILISDNIEGDLLGFEDFPMGDYSYLHTNAAITMMLFFQLFGGMWGLNYLYYDLRDARKYRLYFAPVNKVVYPLAAMMGSWMVSIVQGVIVIVITSLILDVYWANRLVVALALIGVSLFSHFAFALIFMVTKNLQQATAIGFGVVLFIGAVSGALMGDFRTFVDSQIIDFLFEWGTPVSLGRRAIFESGFMGLDGLGGDNMDLAVIAIFFLFVITAITAAGVYFIGDGKRHGE